VQPHLHYNLCYNEPLVTIKYLNHTHHFKFVSSWSTISTKLFYFLEAKIAASLHKLDISAPEKPGVKLANLLA
jgi:hypothetical protein